VTTLHHRPAGDPSDYVKKRSGAAAGRSRTVAQPVPLMVREANSGSSAVNRPVPTRLRVAAAAAQRDHLSSRDGGRPRVVVVIPAHDEAAVIGATIVSLSRQTRPPDRVIVVADNCSDATADLSLRHGAEVMTTVGNTARKAGALNQALRRILPGLGRGDFVLVMDADSQLTAGWISSALDALTHDRRLGGASGTYTGEPGAGLVLQLQRNEFVRTSRKIGRRADLWVLSGTGTMFRVPVLRDVARERGRSLPGIPGEYYCSASITEDYEITLALKTLGHRCVCPPGCTAITELMPTWRHLFRQRLRWQSGTLTALRQYGFTGVTWTNWVRQIWIHVSYCSQLACLAIIVWSLVSHPGWALPSWILGLLLVLYVERLVTVWKVGPRGVLLTVLMVPEWGYNLFDGLFLFEALRREFTQRDISWGHVVRELARHAACDHHGLYPAGWPVPVPETGDSHCCGRGAGPADSVPAQAGAGVPLPRARGILATGERPPSGPPWAAVFPIAPSAGQ
jgi:biofilm PGA synthesis N-glycosyltransferase PgaC